MAPFAYRPNEPAELREFRGSVRAYLDRFSPEARVREVSTRPGAFDDALWKRLNADLGVAGLNVPAAFGGQEAGPVVSGVVLEELGRSLGCVPFLASAVLAADALLLSGDVSAQREWLPSLAAGETVATTAVADADGASPVTATAAPGGSWLLAGRKAQVLHASHADLLLVLAQTGPGEQSFFAVPAPAEGVEVTVQAGLDQTRHLADVEFQGTPARLLAVRGAGAAMLPRLLDRARAALAAEQLGAAVKVLEMATLYASERVQFGKPIGSFQAVKHACATMAANAHLGRGITYRALNACGLSEHELNEPELNEHGLNEHSLNASGLAASAVIYTADALAAAAASNIQLHGAMGFTWEHQAHYYLKRAVASQYLYFGAEAARSDLERRLFGTKM